jgi:ribosomal protein S2
MERKRYGKQIDEAKKYIKSSVSVEAEQMGTKAVNGVWTPGDSAKWSGVEMEYKYKIMLRRAWSQTDTGSGQS